MSTANIIKSFLLEDFQDGIFLKIEQSIKQQIFSIIDE